MKIILNNKKYHNFKTANKDLKNIEKNIRLQIIESEYTVDIAINNNETCQDAIIRQVNSNVVDGLLNPNTRKRLLAYFGIYNISITDYNNIAYNYIKLIKLLELKKEMNHIDVNNINELYKLSTDINSKKIINKIISKIDKYDLKDTQVYHLLIDIQKKYLEV
jgi:hypothetical protein